MGKKVEAYVATAVNAALSSNETNSKKPMPRTMPKLRNLYLSMFQTPVLEVVSTFQIVFSASCISVKTPDAPISKIAIPKNGGKDAVSRFMRGLNHGLHGSRAL